MPFLPRLTDEQIAEALRRAHLPIDTEIVGIFYDNAGGKVEIRTPGAVVIVPHGDLPAASVEPEHTTLFPHPGAPELE